jgi:hypothetical protein
LDKLEKHGIILYNGLTASSGKQGAKESVKESAAVKLVEKLLDPRQTSDLAERKKILEWLVQTHGRKHSFLKKTLELYENALSQPP